MNGIHDLRKAIIAITIGFVLAQASCAPTTQVIPTQTVILETSTPEVTSTPEATSTPTATPPPSATFTPAVTATQMPEVSPAAEGTGNVIGLVLWNGLPVPEAAVWLCHEFTASGCMITKRIPIEMVITYSRMYPLVHMKLRSIVSAQVGSFFILMPQDPNNKLFQLARA